MKTESVHTVILGAGPAGLAAAYTLARAGRKPVVVDREKSPGGLMRSLRRGDFILDIGRKELYNRLEKVDRFWADLLGPDYREYPHRGGILYDGVIIDQSPAYRGFRRGMPWTLFAGCCGEFVWARLRPHGPPAANMEEYFYRARGRSVTRIAQGFQEKLTGRKWAEIALAPDVAEGNGAGFYTTMKAAFVRTFSTRESNTHEGVWRHPARGTGQICDTLAQGIVSAGGSFRYGARLAGMTRGDGKVESVTVEADGETITYRPEHVISSIPLEAVVQHLLDRKPAGPDTGKAFSPFRRKTVLLVYLFLDERPRFPHVWLNVSAPETRLGRITNYAALNGDMVPAGKACLCCEFYCFGDDDPLLAYDDRRLVELALADCAKYGLLDPAKCFDSLVLRLPGADASQNRHNWMSRIRMGLLEELKPYRNLYYVNRTDLDIATLAGLESAEAILAGDRDAFDQHIDPTKIGIRSSKKAFEFRNPAGEDA